VRSCRQSRVDVASVVIVVVVASLVLFFVFSVSVCGLCIWPGLSDPNNNNNNSNDNNNNVAFIDRRTAIIV